MSITVRYPNGQAIRYHIADYVEWRDGNEPLAAVLRAGGKEGRAVAVLLANSGAIVEYHNSCEVSNPTTDKKKAIEIVLDDLRAIDSWSLANLKRKLQQFNAKRLEWKP